VVGVALGAGGGIGLGGGWAGLGLVDLEIGGGGLSRGSIAGEGHLALAPMEAAEAQVGLAFEINPSPLA
jgi:hypothetical protein